MSVMSLFILRSLPLSLAPSVSLRPFQVGQVGPVLRVSFEVVRLDSAPCVALTRALGAFDATGKFPRNRVDSGWKAGRLGPAKYQRCRTRHFT